MDQSQPIEVQQKRTKLISHKYEGFNMKYSISEVPTSVSEGANAI